MLNPYFDQSLIVSKQFGLLERLRAKYGRNRIDTKLTTDDEWQESFINHSSSDMLPPTIKTLLREIGSLLEQIAESGQLRFGQSHIKERFAELQERSRNCGLEELANNLSMIVSNQSNLSKAARSVLSCNYCLMLHWQAASIGA